MRFSTAEQEAEWELERQRQDDLEIAWQHEQERWCDVIRAALRLLYQDYGSVRYGGGSFFELVSDELGTLKAEVRPSKPKYVKRQIHPSTRKRIFERDAYRCKTCDGWENLTIDHIVPESKGGSDEDSNLQTLCAVCNARKGNRPQ